MKVLILSPHPDDAVLSCGQYMVATPGCVVHSIFAGVPDAPSNMEERLQEDKLAIHLCGGQWSWGLRTDDAWGVTYTDSELTEEIMRLVWSVRPDRIMGPLGVKHPDHVQVRRAFLDAVRLVDDSVESWLYEELPYRVTFPELAYTAKLTVEEAGFDPVLETLPAGDMHRKRMAVRHYRTQMDGLSADMNCMWVQERFWRLT